MPAHTLIKIDAPTLCALACHAGVDSQLLWRLCVHVDRDLPLTPSVVARYIGRSVSIEFWYTMGRDAITERNLRAVVRHQVWAEQRDVFDRLVSAATR